MGSRYLNIESGDLRKAEMHRAGDKVLLLEQINERTFFLLHFTSFPLNKYSSNSFISIGFYSSIGQIVILVCGLPLSQRVM